MTLLGHDRYCDEIVAQTERLRAVLSGADLSAPDLSVTVPSCPDWTLGQLVRHLGAAHRWVEKTVRIRAREEIPDEGVPEFEGPDDSDPAALAAWLTEGAEMTAATLRAAGPAAEVWSWGWERNAGFWARRMTHETVIHRADAALAAGGAYEVDPAVAADTIDEFLQCMTFALAAGDPEAAELRGAGRSIHLHATDVPDAEWLIEFGDDGFTWRRGHEKATVALRGPLTEVLRVFYRRLPADSELVEVLGDAKLLDFWLERASFG
ncbi:maleylpyruvate isomerase family mycothiol-dependent enzyme [Streptomyces sp. GMY02]|uniref:maleylpyruvate isomerase family mycothiol-dependent enzyme n=1 Tax=Streptomyces sp. GMY02 TaxID=1333528 RepID=UPI001C2C1665|nr:maleylpyruvate isomerase family mycothiol-dependent enzyme [Streptomyces sp. GMY02]QXE37077.1 maleylpyruvate isomerase family mycothiol-dependent enzyme [Streptomyces sp. GMY02]